jgi:hypothetical protein
MTCYRHAVIAMNVPKCEVRLTWSSAMARLLHEFPSQGAFGADEREPYMSPILLRRALQPPPRMAGDASARRRAQTTNAPSHMFFGMK